LLNDLANLICGTKEDREIECISCDKQSITADASLQEILQADQPRLQDSLERLARVQRVADAIRFKINVKRNRASQGSGAIFGTETSQPQFSLDVSDEAELRAVMAAEVHTPQTIITAANFGHSILRDIRTPNNCGCGH
jgi:hypothetical protein